MSRPIADVNVTPLIDVFLVLLIIFMVVTPLATRGLDTSLPRPSRDQPPVTGPTALVVVIGAETVSLNRQPVASLADLDVQLRAAFDGRSDRTVFVKGEGDLTYGRFVAALDTARGAGAQRIGILTTS